MGIVINCFAEANKVLRQYIPNGLQSTMYNLENMNKLMDRLGNPQNSLKVVHVAGTSGKTSTSYFAAALLHQAGRTVGLTVSPHIDQVNERAQINMSVLAEKEYCAQLSEFMNLVTNFDINPSYFELMVAFAFWLFAKRGLEYAVVEVGLGGLLDGTNVVERTDKVCVITDIGLDHTRILGETIDQIAWQKAGIVQLGNTAFVYEQDEKVMKQIKKRCSEMSADLHIIQPDYQQHDALPSLVLFQKRNFNLAVQTVNYVLRRDHNKTLTDEQIANASQTYIPGRMEVINHHGKTLILDGSHNKQKIDALVDSIRKKFPDGAIAIMASFGENKQESVRDALESLATISKSIILTTFGAGQDEIRTSINPEDLAGHAKKAGFVTVAVEPDPEKALALLNQDSAGIGLITGSFYLLETIRKFIFC